MLPVCPFSQTIMPNFHSVTDEFFFRTTHKKADHEQVYCKAKGLSAAVVVSLNEHLSASSAKITSPSLSRGTASITDGQPLSRFFTASSGEYVRFKQVGGQWQAERWSALNACAPQCSLPVVSSEDVGKLLAGLQRQDVWACRSRIHIMASAHPPYNKCVYLGKSGLLGGTPTQQSPSSAKIEWLPAHTMILTGSQKRTEVCIIPPGYCYKDHRLKEGSVIQNASLTIYYVEANSEEDIRKLEASKDGSALAASLSTNFEQVVTLGMFERGSQDSSNKYHQDLHAQRTKHAGLVLFGKTKKYTLINKESRMDVQLEICVEKTNKASPVTHCVSPTQIKDEKYSAWPTPQIDSALVEDTKPFPTLMPQNDPVLVNNTNLPLPGTVIDFEKARGLLKKKIADPTCTLSDSESIALLTLCVSDGAENAKKIAGKDAVIVIVNTGAGKSTFVNYMLGCDMIQKTPKELGIAGLEKLVAVRSKSEGGTCDEVMPIGHSTMSKTFMPQIAADFGNSELAFCDCPGFFDNRGAEINIANAVNIKRAMQEAKCVKVVILINYNTLSADRGRGLTDMRKICTQLFGSTDNVDHFQDSLLLGVTQVPEHRTLDMLRDFLMEDTSKVMQIMSKRLFLYDPLNRGGADFWSKDQCAFHLAALKGIPQSHSCKMFQTVLTAEDEQKLVEIVEKQGNTLIKELDCGAYDIAGSCWQVLKHLRVIENNRVEQMLHLIKVKVQHVIGKHDALFRDCMECDHFQEAQNHLAALYAMSKFFDGVALELDTSKLEHYYAYLQKKQAEKRVRDEQYQGEQKQYATETMNANFKLQMQEMDFRLSALQSENDLLRSDIKALLLAIQQNGET